MKHYTSIIFFSLLFSLSCLADNKKDCICDGTCGDDNPTGTENPQPHPGDDASATEQRSSDPNELIGPSGYDTLRWVSINDVLNYIIYFENDPNFATVPAQVVDVRVNLINRQTMVSFNVGEYGFANQVFDNGIGGSFCKARLDLRDSMSIYVDFLAGLDIERFDAFWRFSSIDPASGYAVYEADKGLLPVNDSTHIGEGFVNFSIRPSDDMQTGDTLSLMAKILFDQNDTIPTNRWCNRIDAGAPTSKVFAQQDEQNQLLYHLSFSAQDDTGGCGVKHVVLYVSDYLGIWQEYAVCPVDTTIDFKVENGQSYSLMAIGEDYVGNREIFKPIPDTVLNKTMAPEGLMLSTQSFGEDLAVGDYIATISTLNARDGETFVYALAEGDGAIHNDLFYVDGDQLRLKESLRCAADSVYKIRLSTTDRGGLKFSKAFTLNMSYAFGRPKTDTLAVTICEGDTLFFHDEPYTKAGPYLITVPQEFMCDSTYLLQLTVLPVPQKPVLTVIGDTMWVSSAETGNQWHYADGSYVQNATERDFVPSGPGTYYVTVDNGNCSSEPSASFEILSAYTVTVLSADETKGTATGGGEYAFLSKVPLTAIAAEGHHFVQWSDGVTEAERIVTVCAKDTTYTATFAPNIYHIDALSANEEMGKTEGTGDYEYKSDVTLKATANTGYHFTKWTDGIGTAQRTVTVGLGDAQYVAEFDFN
nr:hypothetical protein [Paludibacteraceae bacterium]